MYVGGALTRAVGRPVIRLFKAMPPVFAIVCLAGAALGVVLACAPSIDQEKGRVLIRGLGVLMICGYLAAFVFWAVKVRRGTWRAFCDWWSGVLDTL